MTRRILLILLALPFIAPFSGPVAANPEPTAQEIISKLLVARGGADRVKAVTSVKQTGKIIDKNGNEYFLTGSLKAPNRLRYEVQARPNGLKSVYVFDGETGWKSEVPLGLEIFLPRLPPNTILINNDPPKKMGRGETRDARDEADFNRFNPGFNLDTVAPGNIQVLPSQKFEGIPCHVLKVTGTPNGDRFLFIEITTGLLVKIGDKADVKSDGTLLSDYREVNGVKFPFNIEVVKKGKNVQQTLVETLEVNPGLPDETFAKP